MNRRILAVALCGLAAVLPAAAAPVPADAAPRLLVSVVPGNPGTKIVVRIEMEDMPQFIETSGVVRWCEKEGRNEKDFHAGIEFEPLDKAQLRMIEKMRDLLSSPELQKRRATRRRADPPAIEGGSTPGG